MKEITNSKLNEIDSLLEMIEFLFRSADQEKLRNILPVGGITLTLTQLRAKVYEISTANLKTSTPQSEAASVEKEFKPKFEENSLNSEIKKEKTPISTESNATATDENLADFVKGLSSTLSKRIQMLPIEETERIPPTRQGRIRQLLNKEHSQVNEDTASE